MHTKEYCLVPVAIIVAMLLTPGCNKSDKESTQGQAVIGVKAVKLSRTKEMKSDGDSAAPGTLVTVLEEVGDAITVRLANGAVYWCKRTHLCTSEEYDIRKSKDQIPGPWNVTFIGLGEDGNYELWGHMPIRNGRVAILPGQLIRFSDEHCERNTTFDWGNSKISPKPEAYYLIIDEHEMIELPSWPNRREGQMKGQINNAG